MKQFRSILVLASGRDGGQAAVDQAADLAAQSFTRVTIVACITPLPNFLDVAGTEATLAHHAVAASERDRLNKLAKPLRDLNASVEVEVLQGDVAEMVVQRVQRDGHDLLIKSADQPRTLAQKMFGTVGMRLMRKCPCPVWIIKTADHRGPSRMLVAIDPMPVGEDRSPLNIKIMEIATSLARHRKCELHVAYVWPRWTMIPNAPQTHEKNQTNDNHASKEVAIVNRGMQDLQSRMLELLVGRFRDDGHSLTTHFPNGDPASEVVRLTDELDAELLVLGTVSRKKLSFFQMGGTAEQIIDGVNCSVLAVKPDEFETMLLPSFDPGREVFSFS